MVYRLPLCAEPSGALAERLDGRAEVDVALFLEDGEAVARRGGEELRFGPDGAGWRRQLSTPRDYPDGSRAPGPRSTTRTPATCSSRRRTAYEFADLGGRDHVGGGSHGSLVVGDSEVPMLAVGLDRSRRASPGSRRRCSTASESTAYARPSHA